MPIILICPSVKVCVLIGSIDTVGDGGIFKGAQWDLAIQTWIRVKQGGSGSCKDENHSPIPPVCKISQAVSAYRSS